MLAIVDSGLANLASVQNALARLKAEAVVTQDPAQIAAADRVILPGVGAAAAAMEGLQARGLCAVLRGLSQPVLGICLGMQLMFSSSAEGDVACLGLFQGRVACLPNGADGPVPHMGWNTLDIVQTGHPLMRGVAPDSFVYFVHSFAAPVSDLTLASARYNAPFSAAVARGNFMGCQFHPEKSSATGQRILKNFLEL